MYSCTYTTSYHYNIKATYMYTVLTAVNPIKNRFN